MKRFFGSLDRFNCPLQFIHCNGPGEQTAAVFKGLDRTILWTTGNSVYLLTGTISMDELKQAAEAIQ